MRPRQPESAPTRDLYRHYLDELLDPRHELVLLAKRIDWGYLDAQAEPFFATAGRPAIPTRLMAGLLLLSNRSF